MSRWSQVGALRRVVRRRALAQAGLGALFGGFGGPVASTSPALASPSLNLRMGLSNSPIIPRTTTLTGTGAPLIHILPEIQGRGLEATGGQGQKLPWEDRSGGTGIDARGGMVAGLDDTLVGGAGVVATGGDGTTGPGGHGLFAWGGTGSQQARGGVGLLGAGYHGIVAQGGRAKLTGELGVWGGEGIRAFSGTGNPIDPSTFSAGIAAFGGDSYPPRHAGAGVYAYGAPTAKDLPRALAARGVGGPEAHGVYAEAYGTQSPAILAESGSTAPAALGESIVGQGVAVYGHNSGSGPGASFSIKDGKAVKALGKTTAIQAETTSGMALAAYELAGRAVTGRSTASVGVVAYSETSVGAYFETTFATAAAVAATHAQPIATGGPDGLLVIGDSVVQNGLKPMALMTSLGQKLVYMVEATMSVFEDIGKAKLQNGKVRVDLDPLFAETIETADFQVFLTARGDSRGVYVAARDATGFEIREQVGGTSSVEVNYRIVARCKGFDPDRRLATFSPPPPPPARPQQSSAAAPTAPEAQEQPQGQPSNGRSR